MGRDTRIKELEQQVKFWSSQAEKLSGVKAILRGLADIPENAYCVYDSFGQRVSWEIGKTIKAQLEKMDAAHLHRG